MNTFLNVCVCKYIYVHNSLLVSLRRRDKTFEKLRILKLCRKWRFIRKSNLPEFIIAIHVIYANKYALYSHHLRRNILFAIFANVNYQVPHSHLIHSNWNLQRTYIIMQMNYDISVMMCEFLWKEKYHHTFRYRGSINITLD